MAQYRIPEVNVSFLQDTVARLNKRAKKLKLSEIFLNKVDVQVVQSFDTKTDMPITRVYHIVEVLGDIPRVDGWTFVATLDQTTGNEATGIVFRAVPGQTVPDEFKEKNTFCDHCQVNRLRNETFLLSKDSEYKRVGRTCLKDFFGKDISSVLYSMEFLTVLEESFKSLEDEGYSSGQSFIYLSKYLSYVAKIIRENGWVSSSEAYASGVKTATKTLALCEMYDTKAVKPLADDEALAEAAVEYVRSIRSSGVEMNDFLHNLTVVCMSDVISQKNIGIAAAAINAYRKNEEKKVRVTLNNDFAVTSAFIGTIGDRLKNISVKVLGKHSFEGMYGSTTIYTFAFDGNMLKTFATGAFTAEIGDTLEISGTVKNHKDEAGVKVTFLNRVK